MVNININVIYDKDSLSFISSRKNSFEQIIITGINQFFKDNNGLIISEKMSILISVSSKKDRSIFQSLDWTEDSFTIILNLIKLKESGFDINKHIQYNVPLSKWFVFRKWYGKKSTFLNLIEHEIRHYIDRNMIILEQYIQEQIDSGKKGVGIELNQAIEQIRREAYAKLFDSDQDIEFSHTKLFRIKYAFLTYIKSHGTMLPSDFKERNGWFLAHLAPGDHHYYLAKYMAYIIAYDLMEPNTLLNQKDVLMVKDMETIINKGIQIKQPSAKFKKQAGKLILASDPFQFLQLFEKACDKLNISQKNMPLNYTIFKDLETKSYENQKMIEEEINQELIKEWKQGKITFFQLKDRVKRGILQNT